MSNNNKIELEQLLADYPVLLERFAGADPLLRKTLFQKVDESSFALADWVDSLVLMDKWLDRKALSLPFIDCLSYISCAAESAGGSATLIQLPSLVEDFLEQYGCENAVKK